MNKINRIVFALTSSLVILNGDNLSFLQDTNKTFSYYCTPNHDRFCKNLNTVNYDVINKYFIHSNNVKSYDDLYKEYNKKKIIFTDEVLKKDYYTTTKYKYKEFYFATLSHINFLYAQNEDRLANQLLDINLKNIENILTKSTNTADYIVGLVLYNKTLDLLANINPSKYCKTLHHMNQQSEADVYRLLKQERMAIFEIVEKNFNKSKQNLDLRLKNEMIFYFKQNYLYYENKLIEASKSKDPDAVNNFYKNLKIEEESATSFSFRLFYEMVKIKVLSFLGLSPDTKLFNKMITKKIALVAFPRYDVIVKSNKEIIRLHLNIINQCSKNNL